MDEKKYPDYININIFWRIVTFIFSTIAYVFVSIYYKRQGMYLLVVLGMLISCALSCWLYKKIGENKTYLRIMFGLEAFAYGIFIFLSGGFMSPYLWYEVDCILLMIVSEKSITITIISYIWCILCAFVGKEINELSYQDLNILLGMIMIIGGFYATRHYISYIDKQKEELTNLNEKLEEEKELSNYAFLKLTELNESFSLFAITNPKKIMEGLSILLRRYMTDSGFILIKFEHDDTPKIIEKFDIDEDLSKNIINEVILWKKQYNMLKNDNNNDVFYLKAGDGDYQMTPIGEGTYMSGVLVKKNFNKFQNGEDFYWRLIKIVFSNLDTYSQMEKFIAMDEQNRIANEIHDTVIQKLFGMTCSLAVLENKLKNIDNNISKDEIKSYINMLKHSAELTMTELRESIYGKRFNDSLNTFVNAMYTYMEEVEKLNGVHINMNIDKESDYISVAQKIALYRISCETVNNAVKHGKAKKIDIELKLNSEFIELYIEDDGKGFSKNDDNFIEGNGLKNMKNMAVLLKGNLSIECGEIKGAKVKLKLPR